MDIKLIFIYCMTLLYKESLIPHQDRSIALCKAVNEAATIPDNTFSFHTTREVSVGLKLTLEWMLSLEQAPYNRSQLLQRLRVVTRDETHLYDAFIQGVDVEGETEADARLQVLHYRDHLRDFVNSNVVRGIISNAYNQLNPNAQKTTDYKTMVRSVYQQLEPFLFETERSTHPSVVDQINLNQSEELEELMLRSKEEISLAGVLKTGYQGINRMLGIAGGFRRGEMAVIGALQHHYKTGFSLNLFKQFALYNVPYMRDSTRKPMLLHVSLENELPVNLMLLYQSLMGNEYNVLIDPKTVDPNEASKYIYDRLSVNGYHIEMLRLEPGKCTVNDFFEFLLKYESQGYEVHAVVCDYLNMMNKKDLSMGGPAGEEIRELFRRVRNFCAPRGITFITPHQLSTEAKMLTRQRTDTFVKDIANKGYYDGSKRIDQEVDLEIYIHIEKIGDEAYLTVHRGKHRTVMVTESKHLYCVLPFREAGGVIDDIHGEDRTCQSVGGRSLVEGGGNWAD